MRTLNTTFLKVTGLAIIALALTVFLACGSSSEAGDGDSAINDGGDTAVEHVDDDHEGDGNTGDEIVINMRTENFKFLPETITVKVGQTIRLHLENNDPVLHDYTADEAEFIVLEASGATHDMDMDADEHEEASGEDADEHDSDAQVSLQPLHIAAEGNGHGELVFQATEVGEYEFYCSVPGHREAGMVGTIIIVE